MQMSSGGKPIDDLLFFGVPVLLLLLVLWFVVFIASPLPMLLLLPPTEFEALFDLVVVSLAPLLIMIGSVVIV